MNTLHQARIEGVAQLGAGPIAPPWPVDALPAPGWPVWPGAICC
ncbi:MAG: hypothetical protein R2911_25450 [Caldilineaceae bacterium]